jgi:hypothetical protein
MDDFTSGRKRARAQDWAEVARALGVASETLGARLLAAQQGEPEPTLTPALQEGGGDRKKALAAQFEQSQSLVRAAIARRVLRDSRVAEEKEEEEDEAARASVGTAPESAPGEH